MQNQCEGALALFIAASLCGAGARTAHAEGTDAGRAARWDLGVTGFFEHDSNPLRYSLGQSDSHLRIFPAFDLRQPAGRGQIVWLRSALRRDRYGTTTVLNGLGWNVSVGFSKTLGSNARAWASYDFLRSDQPDVLVGSPLRFASYTQQGATAGLGLRLGPSDALRVEGLAARRSYRGLAAVRGGGVFDQVDPIFSLASSWTHGLGDGSLRLGAHMLWHQSNNPAYRYAMPIASAALERPLGASGRLTLGAMAAWLRYGNRSVIGSPGVLRRDTITEATADLEWGRSSHVTPFLRVAQQWDSSTEPLRRFSDTRLLLGLRLHVWGGGPAPSVAGPGRAIAGMGRSGGEERKRREEASLRVALAYDHMAHRRWGDAVRESRAAATLDPDNPQAWANLGIALFKSGDVAGAREALQRSLSLDPNNERLRALLARPELRR